MDSEAITPCRDPGVDANPKVAVVETRLALAECEGRRELAVAAYEAVRKEFGTSPSKERDEDQ